MNVQFIIMFFTVFFLYKWNIEWKCLSDPYKKLQTRLKKIVYRIYFVSFTKVYNEMTSNALN